MTTTRTHPARAETATLNAAEFAEASGYSYQTVLGWIRSDKLEAEKADDGSWAVPLSELERIRADAEQTVDAASDAAVRADTLRQLVEQESKAVMADAIDLAERIVEAWANCERLGDGAHREAVRERLENVDSLLTELVAVADGVRVVRALGALAVEEQAEAIRSGRAATDALKRRMKDQRRRINAATPPDTTNEDEG